MSYEPTNWKSGDVVTSAKLNKLEQGVAENILIVPLVSDGNDRYLGKTWQEINDATFPLIKYSVEDPSEGVAGQKFYVVQEIATVTTEGNVLYIVKFDDFETFTDDPNGYPAIPK